MQSTGIFQGCCPLDKSLKARKSLESAGDPVTCFATGGQVQCLDSSASFG